MCYLPKVTELGSGRVSVQTQAYCCRVTQYKPRYIAPEPMLFISKCYEMTEGGQTDLLEGSGNVAFHLNLKDKQEFVGRNGVQSKCHLQRPRDVEVHGTFRVCQIVWYG